MTHPEAAATPLDTGRRVEIVDVGLRDGLQDEARLVPVSEKAAIFDGLVAAGVGRLEVTSFAHPAKVPQMADAEELLETVGAPPGVRRIGLVLNERGLERAIAANVDEINVVVIATETFSMRNQSMGLAEALSMWERVAAGARAAGLPAGVTLSAAFGCPFEGSVDPAHIGELADRVAAAGPVEISLADTIGAAVPAQVGPLVDDVTTRTGIAVRCHFHNTRNAGYANALAAIDAGAAALDASIGGIGGCPFAPGATGNVATEDLVHLLERSGISTGIDLDALLEVVPLVTDAVGRRPVGQLSAAGPFPRRPDALTGTSVNAG